VLDEPTPPELAPGMPVIIVVSERDDESVLEAIARIAIEGGMPADYSSQHDFYGGEGPRR